LAVPNDHGGANATLEERDMKRTLFKVLLLALVASMSIRAAGTFRHGRRVSPEEPNIRHARLNSARL